MLSSPPRRLVPFLPILAVLVLGGWYGEGYRTLHQSPGCQAVYAATTRGGASLTTGGLSCSLRSPPSSALVERVVDGDTVVLAGGERVRYIGMDTPEVTPVVGFFGPEATEANRRLVKGRRALLERDVSDRDRFGRLLRYVFVDGVMVNAQLVREGFAIAKEYPPDTKYAACFAALQDEAKNERRGLWAEKGR